MKQIERQVFRTIQKHRLIERGDNVIVAFSGGADSVALLRVLHTWQRKLGIHELHALHVNHQLRGEAAERDQHFCESFCAEYHIPLQVKSVDIAATAKQMGSSIEQVGRTVRYQLLEDYRDRLAQGGHRTRIATGHHVDDQVETFFLNLFRGTGMDGLSGIAYQIDDIIRPLLDCKKHMLTSYAENYCEDQSNYSDAHARNRVRHHLVPMIEQYFSPSAIDHVAKLVEKMQWDLAFWQQHMEQIDGAQLQPHMIADEVLFNLTQAEKGRLIRLKIIQLLGHCHDVTAKDIEAVLSLKKVGSKHIIQQKILVYKMYDAIAFSFFSNDGAQSAEIVYNIAIEHYPGRDFLLLKEQYKEEIQSGTAILVDADAIVGTLKVRYRQPSDVFTPLGMTKTKKIKNFFIDQKIDQRKRSTIPLVCDEKRIVWVYGYRMNEHVKVSQYSDRIALLRLKK